ncbi:hypothetical protein [Pseudorhizobium xiangyangii]|uniref:hypothetical protein n=1 Tax=Pseudorhizobium xiangyangii TaxID=2883104 RepID=UPI001CFF6D43|nr:hypothetical protein [Neorhizobium xiangyangii]
MLFELDPETAARFQARFPNRGDRTVFLRRAVQQVIGSNLANARRNQTADAPGSPVKAEVMQVRFYPDQIARIEKEAAAIGMKPGPWIRAVVDARLNGDAFEPAPADLPVLNQTARVVRKIGSNHNQLTKAAKRAAVNGKPLTDNPLPVLEELSQALTAMRRTLDAVLASRRRYWRGSRDG